MEHFSFGLPFNIQISSQVSMKSFYHLLKIRTHAMQACTFCADYTKQCANGKVRSWKPDFLLGAEGSTF